MEFFERGASEAAEGCFASVAVKLVKTALKKFLSIYMRVKINRAGKIGTILARFGTNIFSGIYMRVEINRAGKFGTILARFGTKPFSGIYIHARGNKSGRQIWDNFGTFWYETFFWYIHTCAWK